MNSSAFRLILRISLVSMFSLFLVACGGGSGGGNSSPAPAATLSGTAAAGAPIIGTVTVKDSSIPPVTRTVTIEANGNYTVDVSGLTGPFMVRADGYVGGNEYHLYSAATEADVGETINITPLTDLIIANIAGTIAEDYFDSGDFSTLTAEQLTTEASALRDRLLPVLEAVGLSDSIDLLRASFATDHSGLDAALDILRVDIEGGTATIRNVITDQQITSNLVTGDYSGDMNDIEGVEAAVTDIQAIAARFAAFSALFANSLPDEENQTLLGLFDAETFLLGGQNLASFLSEITTDQEVVGLAFANIAIINLDVDAGEALVSFDVLFDGEIENSESEQFYLIKRENTWYIQGDMRIAEIEIEARSQYHPSETQGQNIYSGLGLYISDRGGRGITHAVVRGSGMPENGVVMNNNIDNDQFEIEDGNWGNFHVMSNNNIADMALTGESFEVELFDGEDSLAVYTETIRRRPHLVSELSSANFPAITAPTVNTLRAFPGGSMTVSWTLPTGLTSRWLNVRISDEQSSNYAQAEFSLAASDRSQTFTLDPVTVGDQQFTVSHRSIWLEAADSQGHRLATSLW